MPTHLIGSATDSQSRKSSACGGLRLRPGIYAEPLYGQHVAGTGAPLLPSSVLLMRRCQSRCNIATSFGRVLDETRRYRKLPQQCRSDRHFGEFSDCSATSARYGVISVAIPGRALLQRPWRESCPASWCREGPARTWATARSCPTLEPESKSASIAGYH